MSEINAIATNNYILHNIDAKKLYVQEPLFTANSGDAVYVGWRPDETVLWSGSLSVGQTATLNTDYTAFNKLEFYFKAFNTNEKFYNQFGTDCNKWATCNGWTNNNGLYAIFIGGYSATDNNHITLFNAKFNNLSPNSWSEASANYRLLEIRGINRKENV